MSEYPTYEDFINYIDDPEIRNYDIMSLWEHFLRSKVEKVRKEKFEHIYTQTANKGFNV